MYQLRGSNSPDERRRHMKKIKVDYCLDIHLSPEVSSKIIHLIVDEGTSPWNLADKGRFPVYRIASILDKSKSFVYNVMNSKARLCVRDILNLNYSINAPLHSKINKIVISNFKKVVRQIVRNVGGKGEYCRKIVNKSVNQLLLCIKRQNFERYAFKRLGIGAWSPPRF
jgi:hypothetical protein